MGVVPGTGHVHSYSESESREKFSSYLKYFKILLTSLMRLIPVIT
jgi:hypothetical protein